MYLTDFASQNFEEEEEEFVKFVKNWCVSRRSAKLEEHKKQQVKIEVKYTHYIHNIFDNSARISLQK